MTTLKSLLITLPSDQRLKVGAINGVAWFYVGTVGDLTKRMSKYSKKLREVCQRRHWDDTPLSSRTVIRCDTSDRWVEPEGCLRIVVTGQEMGAFWLTEEAGDRFPQMKLRVGEVIDIG